MKKINYSQLYDTLKEIGIRPINFFSIEGEDFEDNTMLGIGDGVMGAVLITQINKCCVNFHFDNKMELKEVEVKCLSTS